MKIQKKKKLNELLHKCEKCFDCELSKTRTNVVFADGNPETARIILIGEAPGENEDLEGVPFIGRAGKLLNEFIEKAGISRESDLYIINTVKCRPPKNRVPTKEEKKACEHFLLEQIKIINPELILLCGATALETFSSNISDVTLNLIQGLSDAGQRNKPKKSKKLPISKIRGEILKIEIVKKQYKAMPIFHPSYLLRNHSLEVGSPRDLMLSDLKKVKNVVWPN